MAHATQQVGIPQRTRFGWQVPSASGEEMYEVEENSWGRWTCSCADYWYRRRRGGSGGMCKHIGAVEAMLLDQGVLMG
jgi:SWIM zinc finger